MSYSSSGFGDNGTLALPIGDRVFSAGLDDTGKIVLRNPDGKMVTGLRAPRPAGDVSGAQGRQGAAGDRAQGSHTGV